LLDFWYGNRVRVYRIREQDQEQVTGTGYRNRVWVRVAGTIEDIVMSVAENHPSKKSYLHNLGLMFVGLLKT